MKPAVAAAVGTAGGICDDEEINRIWKDCKERDLADCMQSRAVLIELRNWNTFREISRTGELRNH